MSQAIIMTYINITNLVKYKNKGTESWLVWNQKKYLIALHSDLIIKYLVKKYD